MVKVACKFLFQFPALQKYHTSFVIISQFEVLGADFAVSEHAHAALQQITVPNAVVGGVKELPSSAALVPLWHGVAHNPVWNEITTLVWESTSMWAEKLMGGVCGGRANAARWEKELGGREQIFAAHREMGWCAANLSEEIMLDKRIRRKI